MRRILPGRLGSLGFQFGLLVLGLAVPLGALLIWQYQYTVDSVKDQVAETQQNYLRLYQDSVDRTLASGIRVLESVADGRGGTEVLTNEVRLHTDLSGLFVFTPGSRAFEAGFSPYVDDAELSVIREWVAQAPTDAGDRWVPVTLDSSSYLVYRTFRGGQVWGAWVDVDQFLQPLYLIDSGQDSVSFFLVNGSRPFPPKDFLDRRHLTLGGVVSGSVVGSRDHYLFVSTASRSGNFDLGVLLPEARYLRTLPSFFLVNALVTLTTLGAILAFLVLFRRTILRPLGILTSAMNLVDGEDLEAQIDFPAGSNEMALIRDTFNAMVSRIHTLKISVYEERLHTQQEELNFLQLQLNPHFFLNSLNILYQLAEVPNLPLLQELIVRLSRYFRFMHNGAAVFLPLSEELSHTENYFQIQQVRFPGKIQLTQTIGEVPHQTPVPPLVIHTFVENAIKYGLRKDRVLEVQVSASRQTSDRLLLRIEDNGPGFPDPVLHQIHLEQKIVDAEREHIGITNVRRRLKIIYGTKASLLCFNRPDRGAVVEISLPIPRDFL